MYRVGLPLHKSSYSEMQPQARSTRTTKIISVSQGESKARERRFHSFCCVNLLCTHVSTSQRLGRCIHRHIIFDPTQNAVSKYFRITFKNPLLFLGTYLHECWNCYYRRTIGNINTFFRNMRINFIIDKPLNKLIPSTNVKVIKLRSKTLKHEVK